MDNRKTNEAQSSDWPTVPQEAKRVQVAPSTIYKACRSGELRHARIGGRRDIRLRPSWTDEWLEASSAPREVKR
jgi:excisionase family DNA binding protein